MTLDQIPLRQMILPLVVFDMTPIIATDPNHTWSVDDIKAWEKVHGVVPAGSFAACETDMYKDWDSNPNRFKRAPFPGLVPCGHHVSLRRAQSHGDRPRNDGHRYDRYNGFRNLDPETQSLSDRNDGQSRQGARNRAVIVVTWPKVEKASGSRHGHSRFCLSD